MYAIILAGGYGTRMNSHLPKVLHRINNVPILSRIVRQLKKVDNIEKIIVVVNPSNHGAIEETLFGLSDNIEYVVQHDPQGTGHAVQEVLKNISYDGNMMVCCGDMPLLHSQVITDFIGATGQFGFIAFHKNNPTGYGRVIRTGDTVQIVEEKDCTPEQRSVTLVNSGTYLFPCASLQRVIHRLAPNNAQHELYLTDAIALLQKDGLQCNVHVLPDRMAYMMEGVNTRADLDRLQEIFFKPCGLLQDNKEVRLEDVVELLGHLTTAPYDREKVNDRYTEILRLYPYIQVYTVFHPLTGLMGLGTLMVEPKFIHDCGKVGRIEDVVVHPYFRREGLGSYIIEHLVSRARQEGCYKVVLDAGPHNHGFYSGLDFVHKENHYEKRF
jgi:bifunctional UDP-N-acetylglucosamine pyrophosphorylase/glucosamine-1-phosphate N-acetyltransferase